ncbi:hypothetical protein [Thiosulfativibrio zosterae]|uniref:Uncharacterized protein n=1 Tax=Thiosulfativibrio zosterae TaxID=2675053 RepID=A0A6F8PKV9_9GAMM|nr:hypothetical protein [Thiosulfativibrio zosterae]BBP42743.1 hypothetical protein THMIRHAT_04890 [Thiosulfativibrio zosterae]
MHFETRATDILNRFKRMLTPEALDAITEEHFSELETLIEAALGSVHAEAKHNAAKRLERLAHELRIESGNAS